MEVVVLGILLAAAAIIAIFLGLQVGSARSAASKATSELQVLRAHLTEAEAEAKKSKEALATKRKEADEFKERMRDVKKRRHEEKEAARFKKDLHEAREQIEREMEKKLARAQEDAEIAKVQLKKLASEFDALKARRAVPAPLPPESKPVSASQPQVVEVAREPTPEEKARAEITEKALAKARQKAEELDAELKKIKGRIETDRRVFLVQKGEIDLAKDKYRALEARFNALVLERDELKKSVWLLEKELKAVQPTVENAAKT